MLHVKVGVAKLAAALALGASGVKPVEVRILSPTQKVLSLPAVSIPNPSKDYSSGFFSSGASAAGR